MLRSRTRLSQHSKNEETGEDRRIEDREEYADYIAPAVIDKIEERDRLHGPVNLVVQPVMELQQEQRQAVLEQAEAARDLTEQDQTSPVQDPNRPKETHDAGH